MIGPRSRIRIRTDL